MASSTFLATVDGSTSPTGFIPVLIMPGMTTLTPTGASYGLQLGPQDVAQPQHAVLGDRVGPDTWESQDGGHRRRVDDVALLTGGQDQWDEGPHAVDDAPEIRVENPMPLLERKLPRISAVHDAGIVHGDVERSEGSDAAARPLD